MSAEQKARDLLERMGIDGAPSMTAGELVELANLIVATKMAMKVVRIILERANSRIDPIDQELLQLAKIAYQSRWEKFDES